MAARFPNYQTQKSPNEKRNLSSDRRKSLNSAITNKFIPQKAQNAQVQLITHTLLKRPSTAYQRTKQNEAPKIMENNLFSIEDELQTKIEEDLTP